MFFLDGFLRRMKDQISKPSVKENAIKIESMVMGGKVEWYIVSVNSFGEAKIIGL